jgi:hypothetical protein
VETEPAKSVVVLAIAVYSFELLKLSVIQELFLLLLFVHLS